jgi:hypothetical protein
VEESLLEAIHAIEAATGKRPKRIEMPDGEILVKFAGVEILCSSSMAGYLMYFSPTAQASRRYISGKT